MDKLSAITLEEKNILAGNVIDKKIYTTSRNFVINSQKLLAGKPIDVRLNTRFTEFPLHRHDYMEMMYIYNGGITHRFKNSSALTLVPGDLIVINRHAEHSVDKSGLEDIGINFIISDKFLNSVWQELDKSDVFYRFISEHFKADGKGEYLYFKIKDIYPIRNLLDNLIYSITYSEAFDYTILSKAVSLLFSYLTYYKNALIKGGGELSEKEKFINIITSYIKQNYVSASLTELSKKINLSKEYLCRNIKILFGKTFKDMLVDYRISVAKTLLSSTDMEISDIISAVGYENKSYFYNIFKSTNGITPREWRKQNSNRTH